MIASHETYADPFPASDPKRPECARPCWRELFGIALETLPSAEFRLEEFLDRIETRR